MHGHDICINVTNNQKRGDDGGYIMPDLTGYATESYVNNKLSNVYTKTEANNRFATKALQGEQPPSNDEYYTKSQIDSKLSFIHEGTGGNNIVLEKTASPSHTVPAVDTTNNVIVLPSTYRTSGDLLFYRNNSLYDQFVWSSQITGSLGAVTSGGVFKMELVTRESNYDTYKITYNGSTWTLSDGSYRLELKVPRTPTSYKFDGDVTVTGTLTANGTTSGGSSSSTDTYTKSEIDEMLSFVKKVSSASITLEKTSNPTYTVSCIDIQNNCILISPEYFNNARLSKYVDGAYAFSFTWETLVENKTDVRFNAHSVSAGLKINGCMKMRYSDGSGHEPPLSNDSWTWALEYLDKATTYEFNNKVDINGALTVNGTRIDPYTKAEVDEMINDAVQFPFWTPRTYHLEKSTNPDYSLPVVDLTNNWIVLPSMFKSSGKLVILGSQGDVAASFEWTSPVIEPIRATNATANWLEHKSLTSEYDAYLVYMYDVRTHPDRTYWNDFSEYDVILIHENAPNEYSLDGPVRSDLNVDGNVIAKGTVATNAVFTTGDVTAGTITANGQIQGNTDLVVVGTIATNNLIVMQSFNGQVIGSTDGVSPPNNTLLKGEAPPPSAFLGTPANGSSCSCDLTPYATIESLEQAIEEVESKIPQMDITGLATEQYVDDAISEVEKKIPEEIDLSGYATIENMQEYVKTSDATTMYAPIEHTHSNYLDVEELEDRYARLTDVYNISFDYSTDKDDSYQITAEFSNDNACKRITITSNKSLYKTRLVCTLTTSTGTVYSFDFEVHGPGTDVILNDERWSVYFGDYDHIELICNGQHSDTLMDIQSAVYCHTSETRISKFAPAESNQTITHATNVSGEMGTFCETNGGIYEGYEKVGQTDCICQVVQSHKLNPNIVGIICSNNQFASHGDVLVKVIPGTYKLGDILVPDISGYARVATKDEQLQMMFNAIPRPKITSLATGIDNTVACFLI